MNLVCIYRVIAVRSTLYTTELRGGQIIKRKQPVTAGCKTVSAS